MTTPATTPATGPATGPAGAVYLYGVARDLTPGTLPALSGVGGAPVRTLTAGRLTALVSTVPLAEYGEAALRENLEDLAWLEETARAHHDVVARAAAAAPTAPVRIATLYRDDARVTALLGSEAAAFAAVLDRITGRSEWGVKAYLRKEPVTTRDPGGGPAPDAGPPTGPPPAGQGTAYLRRRQDERRRTDEAARRRSQRAADLHAELADHAVASRHHPPQDPRLSGRTQTQILNVAYLLDDDQAEGFLAVTRAIGDRVPELELEVTGPWPPYSFIDTAEAARA
ncbi:GvpL/GvpF family gas vesicle protein [Spirillospora albida]|uniref:GvpL/GvpF family gas vesicle protein n=1 Tax=Spirillospora albida TaxID=58123 RepID=UPI0004BEA906|nr:GvpL/GvpF family gas vesicle protein [Spirillospora albida]